MTEMGSIGAIIGWKPYQWPRLAQYWPTTGEWSQYRSEFAAGAGQPGDMYDWGPDLRRYIQNMNKQFEEMRKGLSDAFPELWPAFPSGAINLTFPAGRPPPVGGGRTRHPLPVAPDDVDCDEIGFTNEGPEVADSTTWAGETDRTKGLIKHSVWRPAYYDAGNEVM